ncbi:MAG TPA: hypothetical protein VLX29_01770 [Nitrospirota bacterium]|nr:hypothetical protein [Nitrospirota bacterium]
MKTLPPKCVDINSVVSFCNCLAVSDSEPVDVAARAFCDLKKAGNDNINGDDLAELKKAIMDMESKACC